jgi:lambda family phage portal protein
MAVKLPALLKRLAWAIRPGKRSGWTGAAMNRLTGDWIAQQQSAKEELRWDLLLLRKRAREQERNNPHARRFLNLMVKNVIGAQGIQLEVQTTTTAGDPHTRVNPGVEEAFADWGRPATCTMNGSLGWVGVQALAVYTWARDGEAYVRIVKGAANKYGFGLAFIDADQLDEQYNRLASDNGNQITMGVEHDSWGRPVAYWFWTRHPTDLAPKSRERIPADQIIPIMRPRRYGSLRAETLFAPALKPLRDINGFVEAAVINARTGASKMAFITNAVDPSAPMAANQDRVTPMQADAGTIEELAPGQDIKQWDPAFPSNEFGAFNSALLHYVAAGLDVSAMSLTGDLSQTSYSSGRIGLLDERDTYRQIQGWLIELLHEPVYRAWLLQAVTTGAVKIPSADITRWHDVKWRARGWSWVDPMKEVIANKLAVDFGFSTNTDVCAEDGSDYPDILDKLKTEKAMQLAAGIAHAHPSTVTVENTDDGNTEGSAVSGGRARAADGHDDRRPRLAIAAR